MEGIHSQVHQDKELDIIYVHHDARFVLSKMHQLVIYSAGYKRSVCFDFNSELLRS